MTQPVIGRYYRGKSDPPWTPGDEYWYHHVCKVTAIQNDAISYERLGPSFRGEMARERWDVLMVEYEIQPDPSEAIKIMDLLTLQIYVDERGESLTDKEKIAIRERLGGMLWGVGLVWDKTQRVDPENGPRTHWTDYGGTANHRSMTYKLRKLAGYSYP